jgi:hypothetical protein
MQNRIQNRKFTGLWLGWLGWAYLTKKVPHTATTPIATAFRIRISHRKLSLESPAGES